jgi:hypothetical protein
MKTNIIGKPIDRVHVRLKVRGMILFNGGRRGECDLAGRQK